MKATVEGELGHAATENACEYVHQVLLDRFIEAWAVGLHSNTGMQTPDRPEFVTAVWYLWRSC